MRPRRTPTYLEAVRHRGRRAARGPGWPGGGPNDPPSAIAGECHLVPVPRLFMQ